MNKVTSASFNSSCILSVSLNTVIRLLNPANVFFLSSNLSNNFFHFIIMCWSLQKENGQHKMLISLQYMPIYNMDTLWTPNMIFFYTSDKTNKWSITHKKNWINDVTRFFKHFCHIESVQINIIHMYTSFTYTCTDDTWIITITLQLENYICFD